MTTQRAIKNPAKRNDPWAPDFEIGGGCWLFKRNNYCYTVKDINDEQVTFVDGAGGLLNLPVEEAATLMRPT